MNKPINILAAGVLGGEFKKKYFSKYQKPLIDIPNLVNHQTKSYEGFLTEGIADIFKEFSPIKDYTEKKFELSFANFEINPAKYDEFQSKEKKVSYEGQLKVKVRLKNKTLGTENEQEIFFSEIPLMTNHGTFIINGIERVVIPQLARSYGIFFTLNDTKGKVFFGAKINPAKGAWLEIESEANGNIYVKMDKKRKFSLSSLFRVFGAKTDGEILDLFKDNDEYLKIIETIILKDIAKNQEASFMEIYKKLRDGDLVTLDNAKKYIQSIFSPERYDISKLGRLKFNKRFNLPIDEKTLEKKNLTLEDLVIIIKKIIDLNNDPEAREDDIDHLGSRRVRFVGELVQQKFRMGMAQMKRNIQDRMSTIDPDIKMPVQFISPRPLQARIKEFFFTGQMSQFMQQTNILDELEHLRTLSALGPGGITRERAGFEVRDVHSSHYGRICPIHTSEGANIGLVLKLATYAKINDFGMIETPYVKVNNGIISNEVKYFNAMEEENYKIAHGATLYDENKKIIDKEVEIRLNGEPKLVKREEVDFIDVASNQAFSITTSMMPFLNHNDASRALMGTNMSKQAVPCIIPELPLVATGIEAEAARYTGRVLYSEEEGIITAVDAKKIIVKSSKNGKEKEYNLINFSRTNGFTPFHQRPSVNLGQKVKKGELLADTSASVNGQVSIGQNVLVAFMTWSGSNYEDAIILSEKLVKDNKFSSIYIDEFVVKVLDTKLGPELTTHDIPNIGEAKLSNLDEDGIIQIGSEVFAGDILVGKITPKGETQLTPEEKLLRSIFGEKARDVKDTSKRLESGKRGRVISVKIFSRENGDKLDSGVIKRIHIEVAQLRNISIGDKLAGRHGNKGVISRILPVEEMPYMEDGTPVDVILTPLGIPSRLNLGQIFEIHLGLAANSLNYQAIVPPFMGATDIEIKEELVKAGYKENGKMKLFDGRNGLPFEQEISVGYMYILKLHHEVADKIHMRSIGPYSMVTQQPLGGRAQGGGQRFGEMEVWALLGYGAAYTLREMLTIKSDDIIGRSAAFDSIVKGERIKEPNLPASFNVLLNSLRGLGLNVELKNKKEIDG
ncbi:MAG: DNA-directed RNA polymerase subunit beta [bacterium]